MIFVAIMLFADISQEELQVGRYKIGTPIRSSFALLKGKTRPTNPPTDSP